jgi:ligand-binding sensor domain-containing protein
MKTSLSTYVSLFFQPLLFVLPFACVNQSTTQPAPPPIQSTYSPSSLDTTLRLSYTTGIRSILEDSHGNIWFGDRDTGAWRYDGETVKNFTEKDGLSTTHIWQIYQSQAGELWFAMGDGSVNRFNGESFERIF